MLRWDTARNEHTMSPPAGRMRERLGVAFLATGLTAVWPGLAPPNEVPRRRPYCHRRPWPVPPQRVTPDRQIFGFGPPIPLAVPCAPPKPACSTRFAAAGPGRADAPESTTVRPPPQPVHAHHSPESELPSALTLPVSLSPVSMAMASHRQSRQSIPPPARIPDYRGPIHAWKEQTSGLRGTWPRDG